MTQEKETLEARRYSVRAPALKGRINYFWTLRRFEPFSVDHILMPVGNIDVIYNLGAPVVYVCAESEQEIRGAHLLGVRSASVRVVQSAPIVMIGVSFDDFCALPFLKTPLRSLAHRIIDMERERGVELPPIAPDMDTTSLLSESSEKIKDRLPALESAWLRTMESVLAPSEEELRILHAFRDKEGNESILAFCRRTGTHPKKLERMLYKYVGLPPKQYADVRRAQRLYAEISRKEGPELAHAANDYGYFDQSHMARNVRKLFSTSPSRLRKENITAKSIIRITSSEEE